MAEIGRTVQYQFLADGRSDTAISSPFPSPTPMRSLHLLDSLFIPPFIYAAANVSAFGFWVCIRSCSPSTAWRVPFSISPPLRSNLSIPQSFCISFYSFLFSSGFLSGCSVDSYVHKNVNKSSKGQWPSTEALQMTKLDSYRGGIIKM